MKLKELVNLSLTVGCALTLLACSSMRKQQTDNAAIRNANAAYTGANAQTAGLGEEGRFGEGQTDQLMAKRTYYFDFDSNIVHDGDKPAIYANADYLISHRNAKIILEGHTDPRGSREYNIGLGERRAKSVAQLLATKGVNPNQIRLVSYGAEKLAAFGHKEADYQKDRRVVLAFLQQ